MNSRELHGLLSAVVIGCMIITITRKDEYGDECQIYPRYPNQTTRVLKAATQGFCDIIDAIPPDVSTRVSHELHPGGDIPHR